MKQSIRYNYTSVRLEIDGLPDLSIGQLGESIGIISSWRLEIVGLTQLEGKRDHLETLMQVVIPYARHLVSNVRQTFGTSTSSVQIYPLTDGHKLYLRSSKPDIQPMTLKLDDAQLTDLVRCLDSLRMDTRVIVHWAIPEDVPLQRHQLEDKSPILESITPPALGSLLFLTFALLLILLPAPRINPPLIEPLPDKSKI